MDYRTALRLQTDLATDHYHGIRLKGSGVLNCELTFESHAGNPVTFDNADALLDFVYNERVVLLEQRRQARAARRLAVATA